MSGAARIAAAIAAARADSRTALVPFLTAGYPDRDGFAATLGSVARLGDVVEVGVPFSDPMADGPTIQRSSLGAIANGVSLRWILETLKGLSGTLDAPLVLMSYLNPLLAFGLDALASTAAGAGVSGFIVPDLPYEESEPVRHSLAASGLALVQLVTPATPDERLAMLCRASQGFVYAVTVRGITGGDGGLPPGIAEYLDRVKSLAGETPVCAGFGIRSGADVAAIGRHADGAVVGSALIEALERDPDPAPFLRELRLGRASSGG